MAQKYLNKLVSALSLMCDGKCYKPLDIQLSYQTFHNFFGQIKQWFCYIAEVLNVLSIKTKKSWRLLNISYIFRNRSIFNYFSFDGSGEIPWEMIINTKLENSGTSN